MGNVGVCCCQACDQCEEQAGLSTWSISEPILGWTFSGTFEFFNELSCWRRGIECNFERNIEYASCTQTTNWTDWILLWTCGPCLDCTDPDDPINLPPCPTDINGNVNCPPDYPTYSRTELSARQTITQKYWYNKVAMVYCTAYYRPGQVRFEVEVEATLVGSATAAFAFQQRYRREVRLCVYNTLVSSVVVGDTTSPPVVEPIAPCVDLFGLGVQLPLFFTDRCGDLLPPTEDPVDCDVSDTDTIVEDPCVQLVGGSCVNVPESTSLTLLQTVQCCETPQICGQIIIGDYALARYGSPWYDCDNVPGEIELTLDDFYDDTDVTLNWSCEPFCELSNLTVNFPASLTLTVT